MSERTRLTNGRFLHNLDGWTASGATYSAGAGDDHYGVAVLNTGGDYIEQDFAVPRARGYTLSIDVYAVGVTLSGSNVTARVQDDDGNMVVTLNLSGTSNTWTANVNKLGLAPGGTYTLRITNDDTGADVYIDDVWLTWVPMTRAEMASRVHTKLGRLATDRSLSTAASGSNTEGDYINAVDVGLRTVAALNPETDEPDVRYISMAMLDQLLEAIEAEMLERLERDYAVEVDVSLGPRRENRSQIARNIGKLTGSGSGGVGAGGQRRVVVRPLKYSD